VEQQQQLSWLFGHGNVIKDLQENVRQSSNRQQRQKSFIFLCYLHKSMKEKKSHSSSVAVVQLSFRNEPAGESRKIFRERALCFCELIRISNMPSRRSNPCALSHFSLSSLASQHCEIFLNFFFFTAYFQDDEMGFIYFL
jgi:hypothetical protein